MNKNFLLLALLIAPCAIHGMDDGHGLNPSANVRAAKDYDDGDRKSDAENKEKASNSNFDDPRNHQFGLHPSKSKEKEKPSLSDADLKEASRLGSMKGLAQQEAWNHRVPYWERAQDRINQADYMRKNGPPLKVKMGDAVQDGILGGVSQGVATVVASAIIIAVSKPFGFIWDRTCSCYSYVMMPRSEKATHTRWTNLNNNATKLQTDLELKKLEIRMAQNEFALIEKEKELKTLKDQLQAAKDKAHKERELALEKEREKAVKEFLASKPKDMSFAPNADFSAQSSQGAAPAA